MKLQTIGYIILIPRFSDGCPKLKINYLSTPPMKGTRKKYEAKFKAMVALEAIKERETLNELAVKYKVHRL